MNRLFGTKKEAPKQEPPKKEEPKKEEEAKEKVTLSDHSKKVCLELLQFFTNSSFSTSSKSKFKK